MGKPHATRVTPQALSHAAQASPRPPKAPELTACNVTLMLKEKPRERVDLSPLVPDRLAGLQLHEIAGLELSIGNHKVRVDELFELAAEDHGQLVIANASDKLDRIGAGMRAGTLMVKGDAGAYLGLKMRGGTLTVQGSAGPFAASGLAGGMIRVAGNCGEFLGAALPGERRGMRGGKVIVQGSAGDRVGDFMRRGEILVEGDTGDFCGSRMIAGTIAVLGEVGAAPGYGMQRGTLLLAKMSRAPLATFNDCGVHELSFLPLLVNSWRGLGERFASLPQVTQVRRLMGDLANGGKGEILVWGAEE
jgi:formylmethanofuran dehydrogenase subunit C